jgi:heat shock protein HslJ/uncharacterized membrane protein
MRSLVPLLALSALLVALPARADGLPLLLRCGERAIEVTPRAVGLRLLAGFDRHELEPVPAASGGRYAKPGDPSTWFWSKGERGLASLSGEVLPECVPAGPFRASGNEPFWSLALDAGSLRLERLGREPVILSPPPAARIVDDVHTLEAEQGGRPFRVRIEPVPCVDSMSGIPHPATVAVEWGAERLAGCGGDPGALLRRSAWTLRALGGAPLPSDRPLELLFGTDGRFAGQGPCNRLSGGYRLSGEELRLGPVASTMMACPEPIMAAERRYVEALEKVRGFALAAGGAVLLLTEDGARLELAP